MVEKISERLKEVISKNGYLSLYNFIDFCLYNENEGYYQRNPSISFDFTTAPEVSQLFGECLGIFFLSIIKKEFPSIKKKDFIEFGPGRGTLVKDLAKTLKYDCSFQLVEKSKRLTSIQKKTLKDVKEKCKISWTKKIEDKGKEPIFIYCNEFFDAFPLNQYKRKNDTWMKKIVFIKNNKILSKFVKTNDTIPNYYRKCSNSSIVEYSELMDKYLKKIFEVIKKKGGVFIMFDYAPRNKKMINTLQSIYSKKKCNIYEHPCKSDITHHIDFDYIIHFSKKYRINHYGPITQNKFLINHGIIERFQSLLKYNSSKKIYHELKIGLNRLIDKNQMGELFKCLIFFNTKIN